MHLRHGGADGQVGRLAVIEQAPLKPCPLPRHSSTPPWRPSLWIAALAALAGGALGFGASWTLAAEAQRPTVFHQAQIDSLKRELARTQWIFATLRSDFVQTRQACIARRRRAE